MFDIINISILIVALINFILGIYVFLQDRKNKVNHIFSYVSYSVVAWCLAMVIFRGSTNVEASIFWSRILYLSAACIAYIFLLFTFVFPKEKYNFKTLRIAVISLPFVFVIVSCLIPGWVIQDVIIKIGSEKQITFGLIYFWVYVFYIPIYFGFSFLNLIKKYLRSSGLIKAQLRYIFIGSFFASSLSIITNLILPTIGIFTFNWLGQILAIIFVSCIVYAITRYRLMDIRIVFRKSVVYLFSFLTIIILAFFFHFLFNAFLVIPVLWEVLINAIVAASLFHSLTEWYFKIANKHLFGKLYSQHEALKKLSQESMTIIDLDKLINTIANVIRQTLNPKNIAVFLKNLQTSAYDLKKNINFNEKSVLSLPFQNIKNIKELLNVDKMSDGLKNRLQQAKISILLPLISKNELKGFIIVGEKTSNEAYSKEDTELLETLANQAAIAIENAQLYDQVQDLTQNLQQKVQEQTKDITQLSEMKSEFLRIVNHQLRTPVSILKSMLSMLVEGSIEGKAKQKEAIGKLYLSSERLANILNDLLNAHDLVGEPLAPNLTPSQIEDIIDQTIKDLSISAKQKKLKIIFNQPKEKTPIILLDGILMETAFKKLMDNAILYTEKGNITINLTENKNNLQIIIKDTGIGIPKKDQSRLFKIFSRGKSAEKIHPNGSGLGLFIAKEYIEAHQGTIEIQSEENKGTTVVITLPMVEKV